MIIDAHCHLNFKAFEKDADQVIQRTLAENVWMINVGSQLETSEKAIEFAEKYPQGVFAAVGLHPIHVIGHLIKSKLDPEEAVAQETVKNFDIEDYRKLVASSKKVVAIGEIGLDYYWRPKTTAKLAEFKEKQKRVFLSQLDLAQELDLPVVFHCRSAHDELIETLRNHLAIKPFNHLSGVIHCFTGNWQQAGEYLDMGLYLGFNGIIFKSISGIDWQKIISNTPLDRILVETDAPYLTPPAFGNQRNEPNFVKEVVKEIAKIKKLSYQEVSEITTKNARKLFKI